MNADSKQFKGFYNVIQKSLIVINARRLMEDADLYLQKKTYCVGASKNEKRIIASCYDYFISSLRIPQLQ